jgi:hypothetical protein
LSAQIDSLYLSTRPSKAISRLVSYALFEGRPLTTRGRRINSLVFALFDIEKRLPQIKAVVEPTFIVGTGRSGTTVLGTVLSMHNDIGFLNEPKALWHAIYPNEDLIGSYSQGPARYRLGAEDATSDVRAKARRLFGAYLVATASKRVVDKYPELIFRVPFVRAIFPDARFLFLVRDGWDTCRSIASWSGNSGVRAGGEVHDWWGLNNRKWNLLVDELVASDAVLSGSAAEISTFTQHTDMAAVEWILTMREGLRLVRETPDCVRLLRYEDLVSRPDECLSGVLRFCELPPDEKLFGYARQILRPVSLKEPFDLHPAIRTPFEETMLALDYDR